ncbi:hypothetical protein DL98DRAFT_593146 [Cadophora sp. DSE1049]|nr:hypothetical protein DL98DRAFT_593146 [Cadophora sp. DSE1049]
MMTLKALRKAFNSLNVFPDRHDDKTSPATSFTRFRELPAEIQDKIWDFALATPAVIRVARQRPEICESKINRPLVLNFPPDRDNIGAVLRRVCSNSRLRAEKVQSSFVSNGHIYGNISVDTLWLDFPTLRREWSTTDREILGEFPVWDGPMAPRIAISASGIHLAMKSGTVFNVIEHSFINIEYILYGLYTHGTSELSLVTKDIHTRTDISMDNGIIFEDPDHRYPRLRETEAMLRYLYGASTNNLDPVQTWQSLGNGLLHWINGWMKFRADTLVRKNQYGTVDLEYISTEAYYDMYRDWALGKWSLTTVAYVEATTYRRGAHNTPKNNNRLFKS